MIRQIHHTRDSPRLPDAAFAYAFCGGLLGWSICEMCGAGRTTTKPSAANIHNAGGNCAVSRLRIDRVCKQHCSAFLLGPRALGGHCGPWFHVAHHCDAGESFVLIPPNRFCFVSALVLLKIRRTKRRITLLDKRGRVVASGSGQTLDPCTKSSYSAMTSETSSWFAKFIRKFGID